MSEQREPLIGQAKPQPSTSTTEQMKLHGLPTKHLPPKNARGQLEELANEKIGPNQILEAHADSRDTEVINRESSLLGFQEAGFYAEQLHSLELEIQQVNEKINTLSQAWIKEKEKLIRELYGDEAVTRGRFFMSMRPSVPWKNMSEAERAAFIEKEKRLKTLGFGNSERSSLFHELHQLEWQTTLEKDKRTDTEDLREVLEELKTSNLLPLREVSLNSVEKSLMVNKDPEVRVQFSEQNPSTEQEARVAQQIETEVWFHTTNHLDRMIENGGLATQSWLATYDEEYHRTLIEHSTARGQPSKKPKLSSPFGEWDSDKLYFRANVPEVYGPQIIAYDPKDLVVDTGIFCLMEGQNHMDERVISDVADVAHDTLVQNGKSRLRLPLSSALIAVPKEQYRETCRKFLMGGYPTSWVEEHVFSYRGRYETTRDGQNAAAQEIKRRMNEKRKGERKIQAIPNPASAGKWSRLFQFSTD